MTYRVIILAILLMLCWPSNGQAAAGNEIAKAEALAGRMRDEASSVLTNLLSTAIQRDDQQEVQRLMTEHPELINHRAYRGWTPLRYAAEVGNTNLFVRLIDAGADPMIADFVALTVSNWLVSFPSRPSDEKNQFMLERIKTSSPRALDTNRADAEVQAFSLLLMAESIQKLGSLNQSVKSNGVTVLMYAAYLGNLRACELLIQAGADPALKDQSGKTAKDYAMTSRTIKTPERKEHFAKLLTPGKP